jgi:hypothetical protein
MEVIQILMLKQIRSGQVLTLKKKKKLHYYNFLLVTIFIQWPFMSATELYESIPVPIFPNVYVVLTFSKSLSLPSE